MLTITYHAYCFRIKIKKDYFLVATDVPLLEKGLTAHLPPMSRAARDKKPTIYKPVFINSLLP